MKPRVSLFCRAAWVLSPIVLLVACTKAPNDAQATSDIQAKFAADSGLQTKQLAVTSANGTVTLAGMVDNDAEREAAAKYAASEPGVKTVINNLDVAPAQAAAPPSATTPAPNPAPPKPSPAPKHRKAVSHSQPAQTQIAQAAPPVAAAAPAVQQPAAPPATPPPPPEPQKVTVPSGTVLPVRLTDTIDSATAQVGDTFHATLDAPIAVDGEVVIPAHYDVEGHVINAQASGKFAGRALLELQLDRIKVGEKFYNIQTDQFKQQTGSRGKNTAEKVGGGAIAGAILGGLLGGGKGAAIGSVAGAGAGGGVQAASKKPDIKLSSEKVLTFTLQAPVTVVPTNKPAREGRRLDTGSNP
jgi:BON domain